MSTISHRIMQESESLELEVQAVLKSVTWILGTHLESSSREVHVSNHPSSALNFKIIIWGLERGVCS